MTKAVNHDERCRERIMQEIGVRGTKEHREQMMKHALQDYEEQVGGESDDEEPRVNEPSSASGINEPRVIRC